MIFIPTRMNFLRDSLLEFYFYFARWQTNVMNSFLRFAWAVCSCQKRYTFFSIIHLWLDNESGTWKFLFFFVKRNKSTLGWSCILGEKQKFIEKNHCYLHLNIVRYSRRSFLECQFCQLLFTRGNLTFANSMESFLATLDRKCYSITFRSVSINFRLIIQCICLHG